MPRLLVLGYFSTVIQLNKLAHFVRWDAYTRGGFAIMPYVPAPVIEKLCVITMKRIFIVWSPAILGLFLIIVAKVDLYQFEREAIDIHTMLSRELPILVAGGFLSVAIFFSSFYWLYKKHWSIAIQSFLSSMIFVLFFIIGGAIGASYLNAT